MFSFILNHILNYRIFSIIPDVKLHFNLSVVWGISRIWGIVRSWGIIRQWTTNREYTVDILTVYILIKWPLHLVDLRMSGFANLTTESSIYCKHIHI